VSFSNQVFRAGRRAALMAAALACACALLATLVARNANAAATNTARPGNGSAASNLKMPANSPTAKLRASASSEHIVNFRNSYGKTVWVATMRYNPNLCAGYGDYETWGWLRLEPGEVKQAFTTSYRYGAYYANAADGAEWTGDRGPVYLYHDAFDSCVKIGSTAAYRTVNMRLIDLEGKGPNYTLNLIPPR
jgi:hypothetical protein